VATAVRRFLTILLCLLSIGAHARHRRAEFRAFPPSRASLLAQNAAIDRMGLPRIKDSAQLDALVRAGELVPIRTTRALSIDKRLPRNRAYVRPWVADFLTELSEQFYAAFGKPLQVNSAVRTVDVQRRLRRINGNAAPYEGETASAHLAGVAVDLQRRKLTPAQKRFLQWRLLIAAARGRVIVEEELKQPCFHVVVVTTLPLDTVGATLEGF
jgi:hypothetical protein